MQQHHRSSPGPKRRAFTLVELLIVIGIIALLVGILLPVASKVRTAARRAQTLSIMSTIEQGCEQYYSAFGAYPGVEGNGYVLPNTLPQGPPAQAIQFLNYPGAPGTTGQITSTENLAISLLGGLNVILPPAANPTATSGTYSYDFNAIGLGPASLNSNKPGRSQAFLEIKPTDLTTTVANERYSGSGLAAGQWMGPSVSPETTRPTDSSIPEILDGFSSPHPILYLRANKGNSGFISYTGSDPVSSVSPQYDILQLAAYGFPQSDSDKPDPNGTKTISDYYPANGVLAAGLQSYFGNSELSHTNTSPTPSTLIPQHKDQYILISAGPDGIFGTADDIRN